MQKMIKEKKAISPVITAVLLILLAVILTTIVFIAIKKILKQPQMSPEILCLQLTPPISLIEACFNNITKETEVKLGRINDKLVKSLEFIFKFESKTLVWCCGQNCENCKNCEVLTEGSKTYYISTEEKAKTLSLRIDNCIYESKNIEKC